MIDLIKPYINLAFGIILIGFLGYTHYKAMEYGEGRVQPKLDALQAKVDKADSDAKLAQKQQEINTNAITQEYEDRIARIRKYYAGRMLPRSDQTNPNPPADSPKAPDGQTTESSPSGSSLEERCTIDAFQVIEWQNWALVNHFPVGK